MDYKLQDVEINITSKTAEFGDIKARFYTEDDGSAYIRMAINGNGVPLDFNKTDLVPRLTIFAEDDSIFSNELVDVILPEKGIVQYKVSDNVIRHSGRMHATLLLVGDKRSLHAANFYFTILDSGLIGPIGKEVNVDSLKSVVSKVMKDNPIKLLFDNMTDEEKKLFKGERGADGGHDNYLRIDNPNDATFFLAINDNDVAACRYFKDTTDEFMKGYENYIISRNTKISEKISNANYNNVISGSMDVTTTNNHYTTKVGTTISHDFKGTYIEMNVFSNSSGGVWKALIDDVEVAKISTYSSTSVVKTVTIASNLSNDNHNLKLEFIGADPEHPVTTPRGWIRYSTDTNNIGTSFTSKEIAKVTSIEKPANFTLNFSNKEYALNVRDAEKTKSPEWFPAHNGVDTTYKGENFVRTLIADGNVIDLNKRTPEDIYFKKAQLIQKVENKLTSDSSPRAEITFIVTFENGRAYQDIKIKWLQDSEITSGYIFQMPFLTEWFDRVITDKFEVAVKDTVNIGVSADINNLNTRVFTGVSDKAEGKNYIYRSVIEDMTENFKEIKLARRSDSLQKLYPTVYKYTTKKAGTIDHFSGYYEFAKVPDANLVYKI